MQQTDIFSLFGIEDEYAEKKKEEEERMKQQAELQKKMEETKKNGTSAAAKKEEFEVNANTVIYFYTEVIDINDYFTAEELEFGIAKKKNGEVEYKKITENDVKNRLKKDYPVLEAGAELVYLKKKNIISVILKAKKKGINTNQKESNTDSFADSKRKIPFGILRDFISIAKFFSDKYGCEVHADIYLNVDTGEFFMDIPEQRVHPLWVEVTESPYTTVEKFMDVRHIKVMEIHSHHNMPPIPSSQDDESERMPLLYAIVGNIKFFPEISCRTFDMNREKHINLDPWQIFENPFDTLPSQYDLTVVEVVK